MAPGGGGEGDGRAGGGGSSSHDSELHDGSRSKLQPVPQHTVSSSRTVQRRMPWKAHSLAA